MPAASSRPSGEKARLAAYPSTVALSSRSPERASQTSIGEPGRQQPGTASVDAQDGERLGPPIEVGKDEINPVSFSPDGRLLAASTADQTATVWDLASRERLGNTFPAVQGVVPIAQFAPDGDLVIAYAADAVKWPMDPRNWMRFACRVAGRDLTPAEWGDVLPDREYRRVCP